MYLINFMQQILTESKFHSKNQQYHVLVLILNTIIQHIK